MSDYRADSGRYRSSRSDSYDNRRRRDHHDGRYDNRAYDRQPRAPRDSHPETQRSYPASRQRARRTETLPSQSGRLQRADANMYHMQPQQGSRRRQAPPQRGSSRSPYLDDQVRKRAANSGNYRARSSQMMSQRDMRQPRFSQPAPQQPQRSLVPRLAIAAVLLVVLILRFVLQGGVFGQFGSVSAQVNDQQTQLEQLTSSNNDMQAKMNDMQGTIDAWNEMRSK